VAAFVGSSNVLHGTVWERYVHFGRSAVAGAHHIPDGRDAVAYIRPHDIEITAAPGEMSFPIAVERRTDMGWMAKLYLRLEDGQPLVAQLPNEEIESVSPGQRLYANLRNPKVFSDDRVKTDADIEPVPDEREEDAENPAERSELTPARQA
jgi:sulfate transport system ATP-binding protein